MTVTSIGVLLSLLIQSSNAGIAVTQIIALGGAVLGGLWMPIEMLPDVIQNIGKFTPQYWTHQAFQEAMAGTLAFSQFLKVCGILLGITVFYEKRKINTGGTQVKINVDIDDKYKDTQITIQANEWSPEIQRLIDFINQQKPDRLFGVDGEQTVLLDPNEIDFFHVE